MTDFKTLRNTDINNQVLTLRKIKAKQFAMIDKLRAAGLELDFKTRADMIIDILKELQELDKLNGEIFEAYFNEVKKSIFSQN